MGGRWILVGQLPVFQKENNIYLSVISNGTRMIMIIIVNICAGLTVWYRVLTQSFLLPFHNNIASNLSGQIYFWMPEEHLIPLLGLFLGSASFSHC